ncbi:Mss4-like protein [Hypoxylon sp. FL1284]|nr:Mss4-like protein [Hypoxylon sp. FL1284]
MEPTPKPASEGPLPVVLRGSCLCGTVHVESRMLPEAITACHCVECRKASSNPFLTFGLFHNDYVQWAVATPSGGRRQLHGDLADGIRLTYYSDVAVRGWCARCGTPLFMKYHCRPDGTSITLGMVDDQHTVGTMPPLKEHIFLAEKAAWWNMPPHDGAARHAGFNEPFSRRLQDWKARGRPQRLDLPPPPTKFKL